MKRIVLFSMPTDTNIQKISELLFPKELTRKIFAYLPVNGKDSPQKYTDFWKDIADKHKAEFRFIDNTISDSLEKAKLLGSNILLITGGNTFELLNNLRNSGLDKAIKDFTQKDEFILAGFSAGAIVLSPTIESAQQPAGPDPEDLMDENLVGITDLTGLGIIDFEVFPHFVEVSDRETLKKYQAQSKYQVKEITDEDYIVLDR